MLINTQFTIKNIAEYYNVTAGTIKHINSGKNHYNSELKYPLKTGRAKGEKYSIQYALKNMGECK